MAEKSITATATVLVGLALMIAGGVSVLLGPIAGVAYELRAGKLALSTSDAGLVVFTLSFLLVVTVLSRVSAPVQLHGEEAQSALDQLDPRLFRRISVAILVVLIGLRLLLGSGLE